MDKGVTCKIRELGQLLKDQPDQELDKAAARMLRQEISHNLDFPRLIADHAETFMVMLVDYCDRAGIPEASQDIRDWLGRAEPANAPELPRADAPQPKPF